MSKIILVIVFIQLIFTSLNCNESKIKNQARLSVKGRLVSQSSITIRCGVLKIFVATKFINLEDNQLFLRYISCPEIFGHDYFKSGSDYSMQIEKAKITTNDVYINDFKTEIDLPVYLVEEIIRSEKISNK